MAKVVMHLEVDIVLRKMLPCKVTSLVVFLKSMMIANAVAT